MPRSRSNKESQAQARRRRLSSHKVTKSESLSNPKERGRAGLTKLTSIGQQGVFDDIQLSPGTFTLPTKKTKKKRR